MDIAVLLCNNYPEISIRGSIIDAFEYYFAILEHNKSIKLFLIDFSDKFIDCLISIVEERYFLDDLNWKSNIIKIKRSNIVSYQFERVLILDYTTINRLRGLLRTENLVVISEMYTDSIDYMFSKDLYNVTYYGEMPFVYKDFNYRMKFLFDRFKSIGKVRSGCYIHSTGHHNVKDIPVSLGLNSNTSIYFKKESHMDNFFEYFDVYIYYHSGNYFDPHPRLPIECLFYNKTLRYVNDRLIKDGSYYRFKDLQLRKLTNRTLNKNDEIVRQFI